MLISRSNASSARRVSKRSVEVRNQSAVEALYQSPDPHLVSNVREPLIQRKKDMIGIT